VVGVTGSTQLGFAKVEELKIRLLLGLRSKSRAELRLELSSWWMLA
jgi:hypothetical protein